MVNAGVGKCFLAHAILSGPTAPRHSAGATPPHPEIKCLRTYTIWRCWITLWRKRGGVSGGIHEALPHKELYPWETKRNRPSSPYLCQMQPFCAIMILFKPANEIKMLLRSQSWVAKVHRKDYLCPGTRLRLVFVHGPRHPDSVSVAPPKSRFSVIEGLPSRQGWPVKKLGDRPKTGMAFDGPGDLPFSFFQTLKLRASAPPHLHARNPA